MATLNRAEIGSWHTCVKTTPYIRHFMENNPSPLDRFRVLFNIVPNRLRVTLSVEKLESFLADALAEEYARGREEGDKEGYYKGRLACIEQIHGTKRDPVRAIMEEFAGEQRNKTVDYIEREIGFEKGMSPVNDYVVSYKILESARTHEN